MAYEGQSDFVTVEANTVLDFEVTRLHADAHTKTMCCVLSETTICRPQLGTQASDATGYEAYFLRPTRRSTS